LDSSIYGIYFKLLLHKVAMFKALFVSWEQIFYGKGKGKAVPLQTWSGPEGSRKLRFPDFMTTAQMVVRLSTSRSGRLQPQEIHLVLISVRG